MVSYNDTFSKKDQIALNQVIFEMCQFIKNKRSKILANSIFFEKEYRGPNIKKNRNRTPNSGNALTSSIGSHVCNFLEGI